jgi:hypothetical protein
MFEFQPCHYYEKFHNVFACYVRKTQKNQMPKKLHYFIWYNVVLKYMCVKKKTSQHMKKWKYILEMVEIIYNLYKMCCDVVWLG